MAGEMTKRLSRRAVLAGGAAALGSAVLAEAPLVSLRPLARPEGTEVATGGPPRPQDRIVARQSIDDLIAAADLGGVTGVVVADLDRGETLEARSEGAELMPASVTKAVTALYALDALGVGHRFETRVLATGPVDAGVLDGDLILEGGGDPVLDTDALAGLVDALVDAGVRQVRGGSLSGPVWPRNCARLIRASCRIWGIIRGCPA